jgi:hypothetical protein
MWPLARGALRQRAALARDGTLSPAAPRALDALRVASAAGAPRWHAASGAHGAAPPPPTAAAAAAAELTQPDGEKHVMCATLCCAADSLQDALSARILHRAALTLFAAWTAHSYRGPALQLFRLLVRFKVAQLSGKPGRLRLHGGVAPCP